MLARYQREWEKIMKNNSRQTAIREQQAERKKNPYSRANTFQYNLIIVNALTRVSLWMKTVSLILSRHSVCGTRFFPSRFSTKTLVFIQLKLVIANCILFACQRQAIFLRFFFAIVGLVLHIPASNQRCEQRKRWVEKNPFPCWHHKLCATSNDAWLWPNAAVCLWQFDGIGLDAIHLPMVR